MKLKNIRSKIMASITGITFLTVIGIAAVFCSESAKLIEEKYVTLFQQRISLLSETIDEMLMDVCYVGINASCDNEIEESVSEYLKTGNEKELVNASERLRIYKNREDAISSIYLFIPETSQIVTTMDYPVYKSEINVDMATSYATGGKGPVIISDIINSDKRILSFVEDVKDSDGKNIALLYTNIEENKLFYDFFDNTEDAELKEFVLLRENQVIASKSNFRMGDTYKDYKKVEHYVTGRNVTGADGRYIYVYSEGNFSGCGIFAQADKKIVLSDMSQMGIRVIEMAVIFILLSFIPAAYITKAVTKPVRKLVNTVQNVSEGDMDARTEKISDDEIGLLSEKFNQMLDQIQELIHQVIVEEEMKKDAELEALQYQITPHFMYNTLNSIKCAALIKGEKELAKVVEDFVELLQTCISKKGSFLTVAEEVHILEKYICLQEFRSGESFQVKYEIQSEAAQCLIPRLILQPLVENALIHGMDIKQKRGQMIIRAWTDNGVLYMEVEDNGRGMTVEQINNLLRNKAKKTKGLTAVGVPNVRDRLKLYYKEKAQLSYRSSSEGTTASIYLPEIKDEE